MKKRSSSAKMAGSNKLFLALFAAVVVAVVAFAVVSKAKVTTSVAIGDAPPGIALNDLAGRRVAIPAELKGKVVFMHFWVSSCSHCVNEMCTLESFYRKHNNQGVIAFSINAGEDKQSAARYVSNLNISYPILLDPDLSVTRRYGVSGVPTTFILDRQGVLRFKIMGEITNDKLDQVARTLL
jgi:cytochrome c biogenesis protein CcmG, thiol:disulfide interchange protein DsbE